MKRGSNNATSVDLAGMRSTRRVFVSSEGLCCRNLRPFSDSFIGTGISGEAMLEDRAQTRLSGVLRGRFLHLQHSFPTTKLEGGEVVREPGLFVH
jgi:hypothetical protein